MFLCAIDGLVSCLVVLFHHFWGLGLGSLWFKCDGREDFTIAESSHFGMALVFHFLLPLPELNDDVGGPESLLLKKRYTQERKKSCLREHFFILVGFMPKNDGAISTT